MNERVENIEMHLRSNALAWLTLRHFLTADLLSRLSCIIVDEATEGKLQIDQLFEEIKSENDSVGLESWIIKPREIKDDPLAAYLQRRIRTLAWQHDNDVGVYEASGSVTKLTPEVIERAIQLSCCDLSSQRIPDRSAFPENDSVKLIVDCFSAYEPQSSEQYAKKVNDICERMDWPLAPIVLKHFGDICADADDWRTSVNLYQRAQECLGKNDAREWFDYVAILRSMVTQSIAAAQRIINGPREAGQVLRDHLEISDLEKSPIFFLNAGHDELVSSSLGREGIGEWRDTRSQVLFPPLLLNSHDRQSALQAWLTKNYESAIGYFWETLRREIALGSASESRLTKAFYSSCILEHLAKYQARHVLPKDFWLAVRLLLESGQSNWAETLVWNEAIVQTYVNEDVVDRLNQHVKKYRGSIPERLSVAIEIANKWLEILSPDKASVTTKLIAVLTETATSWPATFDGRKNIGGRSLEILGRLAKSRPEFRRIGTPNVVRAVLEKIREPGFWTGRSEALKVSLEYLDVLNRNELNQIVEAILSLLSEPNFAKGNWPIVGPAIDILMSDEIRELSKIDESARRRILSTVTSFGIGQGSEHTRLLYYVRDFEFNEISGEMHDAIKIAVEISKKDAAQISASNATQNINVLLLAPRFAAQSGIETALEALGKIIRTATERRPSISFARAYEPLRILASNQEKIAIEGNINKEAFAVQVHSLLPLIKSAWKRSESDPALFVSFAIPPSTKPDQTIVHNWALASIIFAEAQGERRDMLDTLGNVAQRGILKDGIELAKATLQASQLGSKLEKPDLEMLGLEARDTFYRALGARLVYMQGGISQSEKRDLLQTLLDQCLKLGPRGIDAAVFVLAYDDGTLIMSAEDYEDYEKRLEQNRDLRVTLIPTLINLNNRTKKN